jgi:hypothetical protein
MMRTIKTYFKRAPFYNAFTVKEKEPDPLPFEKLKFWLGFVKTMLTPP